MAEQLYFSRDTKVYLEQGSNVWELLVLDGFSFSQATNTSEVTPQEMTDASGNSRRGRKVFTDSYAPAEWSFSTYIRPFLASAAAAEWEDTAANVNHCVEEMLWANFVAANAWTPPSGGASAWSAGVTYGASGTGTIFDFDDSNKTLLGTFNLYFELNGDTDTVYKIANCVIGSATVNFDIDGIATIEWSGMGGTISESTAPAVTVSEALTSTATYIRNRLTALTITAADTVSFPGVSSNGVYNLVLTGGSIAFENNISYLTPETLGIVNQPLGHVTGNRTVGGSFTAYLNADTGSTAQLFNDIQAASTVVTNEFDLTFYVGGASGTPRVEFNLPQCHISIPTHDIGDVIGVSVDYAALPSTVSATDEATIKYVGVAY